VSKRIKADFVASSGPEGLKMSWQTKFPKTVKCEKCGKSCRHAMTVQEIAAEKGSLSTDDFVAAKHRNEGKGGWWPHDVIAVAVYFCRDCFHAQVEWNQA